MAKILVIDDDPHFRALLRVLLESHEHEVFLREAVVDDLPDADVVILDWQLGEQDGLELLGPLSQRLAAPVILSTAHSSPEVAAQAIKAGAYDFLTKPVDEARLVATVGGALTQRRLLLKVNDLQRGQRSHGLVGDSHALRQVLATIDSVAGSDVSVMITGESGTGKELVARALHDASERRSKPFLALNMAAIPKDLVESTLFGHERGAFSGADRRRIGAVEEARGGTLFLDEIGEMPLDLQSKLLRFLQERRIRRVGGTQDLEVDVRIVSATNRDPLRAVADGRLREDLYYRLNVVPIPLPPLRERHGDVALLATHFLVEAAERFGKALRTIGADAMARLEAHAWPGNVRELRHTMERLVIMNQGETLTAAMLPREGAWAQPIPPAPGLAAPASAAPVPAVAATPTPPAATPPVERLRGPVVVPLAELERLAIEHALEVHDGNRNDAAAALGISPATIYRKLKAYGLTGAV